jgi:hypothetical protein
LQCIRSICCGALHNTKKKLFFCCSLILQTWCLG